MRLANTKASTTTTRWEVEGVDTRRPGGSVQQPGTDTGGHGPLGAAHREALLHWTDHGACARVHRSTAPDSALVTELCACCVTYMITCTIMHSNSATTAKPVTYTELRKNVK